MIIKRLGWPSIYIYARLINCVSWVNSLEYSLEFFCLQFLCCCVRFFPKVVIKPRVCWLQVHNIECMLGYRYSWIQVEETFGNSIWHNFITVCCNFVRNVRCTSTGPWVCNRVSDWARGIDFISPPCQCKSSDRCSHSLLSGLHQGWTSLRQWMH